MLHEAGHLLTAKRFGMKATQFFAGFGPTLFSFRRGETEYGLKAIPAGGFVKIVGMTPLEEVPPADRRARPSGGSRLAAHRRARRRVVRRTSCSPSCLSSSPRSPPACPTRAVQSFDALEADPVIGRVTRCVVPDYELDKDGVLRGCRAGDPVAPARAAGLERGDAVVSFDGARIATYGDLVEAVRAAPAGPVELVYVRDGERRTTTADLVATRRPPVGDAEGELQTVSAIGVSVKAPRLALHYSVAEAVPTSVWYLGQSVELTFEAIGRFPSKIPKLLDAINGDERDPETPISVVGASRVGGEAVELGLPDRDFLALLGGLNVFIGVFNLLPLLPLDGGHVAIAWFERRADLARRAVAATPDPGAGRLQQAAAGDLRRAAALRRHHAAQLTADIVNPISLR